VPNEKDNAVIERDIAQLYIVIVQQDPEVLGDRTQHAGYCASA
jgi:hypothetical protein